MAFTQSDLTTIDQCIASGNLQVRYNDRMVTYRSIEELIVARDLIVRSLETDTCARQVIIVAEKGY